MKKTLTRSLLLCGMLAFVPVVKAAGVRKQSDKTAHKQKQADDAEQDDDKPASKKPQAKSKEAEKKDEAAPPSAAHPAAVSNINLDDLAGFSEYPKQVRSLVESALALTHLGLTYKFGGSNPSEGGMDCSGTIYHVLRFQGLKDVPRQSDEMCAWVRDHSHLHETATAKALDDADFAALRPGDLMFWTGTYKTDRKLPITHVMLYLGKLKKNGKPIVFGASDGRYYAGERRSGVSVFDLSLPREGSEASLYGYGPAPGLLPAAPREELVAKAGPSDRNKDKVALAEGETILPAIVVLPHPNSKDTEDDKPDTPKKSKTSTQTKSIASTDKSDADEVSKRGAGKKISEAAEPSLSKAKNTVSAKAKGGEDDKPAATKKKGISDDEKSTVADKSSSKAKSAAASKSEDSANDKPAPAMKKTVDQDDEKAVAKKSPPSAKTKSTASARAKDDVDDQPKKKSSVTKKSVSLTPARDTAAKKKPQASPGREVVDETGEALRRAAKSIKSVFE